MEPDRLDPFRQALVHLRRALREGDLRPGARVSAKAIADALTLSPTPVREALARLAGEGALEERRREGYFVPTPTAADIAALYHLSEQTLRIAQGRHPSQSRPVAADPRADPLRAVDRLFLAWAADAESAVTRDSYRFLSLRLAPVRRCEAFLLPGLAQEAEALFSLAASARRGRGPALRAFHGRRIAVAEGLARCLRSSEATPDDDAL